MTASGQIEQFPPPGLGDRFALGQETFAGTHGNRLPACEGLVTRVTEWF
jgi:hypothetical protein